MSKKNNNITAIAYFNDGKVKGSVHFYEEGKKVLVKGKIKGLKKNFKHGFHVHQAGDLSEKCKSMCAHFNPTNKKHGGRESKERHVGDLGNIESDQNGTALINFYDKVIKLRGKHSIIGRGLVIHSGTDDLGLGGHSDSLTTGHAGKRLACSVIGYAKENFKNC